MFAFAIFDRGNRRLFCARDRIGIKPFYYAFDAKSLIFASEIKAILASGYVQATPNMAGLQDYLTFQFCLGEKTLFKGVEKLEPGCCMTVQIGDDSLSVETRQYWDVSYEIDDSHGEAWFVDHLAGLIEDATRIHLRSDVPLGAHLSGGLDSSVLVCIAADCLKGERIKTFTGAFSEGPQFDETAYAKAVAALCWYGLSRGLHSRLGFGGRASTTHVLHGRAISGAGSDSPILCFQTGRQACEGGVRRTRR
jgi:asparagine synthase (glutamine-hydrolysing)